MATQHRLTWAERKDKTGKVVGGRWRKRYRGQWLSYPGTGGKVASYQKALEAFRKDRLRIDNELATDNPLLIWIEQQQADILATYCDSKELRFAYEILEDSKAAALALTDEEQKDSGPFSVMASTKRRLHEKVFSVLSGVVKVADVGKVIYSPAFTAGATTEELVALHDSYENILVEHGRPYKRPTIEEIESQRPTPTPIREVKEPMKPIGIAPWEQQIATVKPTTLGELGAAYVCDRKKTMEAKAKAGKKGLSIGRFDNSRYQVERFVAYAGDNLPLDGISSLVLNNYRHHVQADDSISDATKNERLRGVKDVLRWAVAMDFIDDEPKFIRRGYSISQTAKEIKLPSKGDVVAMLDAATPRVKLYALLALNTGMLQKDMSDLKRSEVTLGKTSTIRRRRSKTNDNENTPIVTYKLWARTAKLLKQEMVADGESVLLNADGGPLVSDEIKANGKRKKLDCVDSAWDRLRTKTGKPIPFKMLRKFAASLLASHAEYGRYAQYFLGHAPDTTADRNYVVPSDAQFAKALTWLESAIFDA